RQDGDSLLAFLGELLQIPPEHLRQGAVGVDELEWHASGLRIGQDDHPGFGFRLFDGQVLELGIDPLFLRQEIAERCHVTAGGHPNQGDEQGDQNRPLPANPHRLSLAKDALTGRYSSPAARIIPSTIPQRSSISTRRVLTKTIIAVSMERMTT